MWKRHKGLSKSISFPVVRSITAFALRVWNNSKRTVYSSTRTIMSLCMRVRSESSGAMLRLKHFSLSLIMTVPMISSDTLFLFLMLSSFPLTARIQHISVTVSVLRKCLSFSRRRSLCRKSPKQPKYPISLLVILSCMTALAVRSRRSAIRVFR